MLLVGHVTQLASFNCTRVTAGLRRSLYGSSQTFVGKNICLSAKENECNTAEMRFEKLLAKLYKFYIRRIECRVGGIVYRILLRCVHYSYYSL